MKPSVLLRQAHTRGCQRCPAAALRVKVYARVGPGVHCRCAHVVAGHPYGSRAMPLPCLGTTQPALETHAAAINAANTAASDNAAAIATLRTALETTSRSMAVSIQEVQTFLDTVKQAVDALTANADQQRDVAGKRVDGLVDQVSSLRAKLDAVESLASSGKVRARGSTPQRRAAVAPHAGFVCLPPPLPPNLATLHLPPGRCRRCSQGQWRGCERGQGGHSDRRGTADRGARREGGSGQCRQGQQVGPQWLDAAAVGVGVGAGRDPGVCA